MDPSVAPAARRRCEVSIGAANRQELLAAIFEDHQAGRWPEVAPEVLHVAQQLQAQGLLRQLRSRGRRWVLTPAGLSAARDAHRELADLYG